MTDAILENVSPSAWKSSLGFAEFSDGKNEAPPVEDDSMDVATKDCVLNLAELPRGRLNDEPNA
jgi:hypothetical protein